MIKPTTVVQTTPQKLTLMDITKKFADLEVKLTRRPSKRPQPTKKNDTPQVNVLNRERKDRHLKEIGKRVNM